MGKSVGAFDGSMLVGNTGDNKMEVGYGVKIGKQVGLSVGNAVGKDEVVG